LWAISLSCPLTFLRHGPREYKPTRQNARVLRLGSGIPSSVPKSCCGVLRRVRLFTVPYGSLLSSFYISNSDAFVAVASCDPKCLVHCGPKHPCAWHPHQYSSIAIKLVFKRVVAVPCRRPLLHCGEGWLSFTATSIALPVAIPAMRLKSKPVIITTSRRLKWARTRYTIVALATLNLLFLNFVFFGPPVTAFNAFQSSHSRQLISSNPKGQSLFVSKPNKQSVPALPLPKPLAGPSPSEATPATLTSRTIISMESMWDGHRKGYVRRRNGHRDWRLSVITTREGLVTLGTAS
jgi:hypothetical protein